jgi:hypothetical protein
MNAKLFPANSEVIEGQAAIEGFWGGAMKMGIKKAILETLTAEQVGNIAIEEGIYKLFVDGDIMVDQGKYLVTWQKEDGKWKMHRDIWNTIHPAPRAMAAENDSVWIISYRIKADKVKQFEEFNFKYMLPAAAELFPQVRNTARLLRPVEPNQDGSYTYFYVMDGMKARKNYEIDTLLVARYGEEKAKEYLTMFLECLTAKGHDEVMTVQTAL